ncbi:MAG: hypothetical protein KAS32_17250 [Candidatus Peribacteraceae bacterium]|nr:hypothetical protein [Candidatus Peribacteraceae bacterium]
MKCPKCEVRETMENCNICAVCFEGVKITPAEILAEMAETFKKRHKIYGDNYKQIGEVMKAIFPVGIDLLTPEQHNNFSLFSMMIVKVTRLANSNLKHKDSVHDLAVYAAMMESLLPEGPQPVLMDTKRLNAIVDGHCITCEINNGVYTWVCLYNGQKATGSTIRQAIDKAMFKNFDKDTK